MSKKEIKILKDYYNSKEGRKEIDKAFKEADEKWERIDWSFLTNGVKSE